ncbi:unnamed protein product [Brachionus calyciflorus]|uniref:Transposase Tc1-like domain-containing protein n=1 Tax=Brachionus calyciflorus TaxID=104777 RepID=A0A814MKX9_9BILA|nr:unnamed protein product [Brachionus calyciflorus]
MADCGGETQQEIAELVGVSPKCVSSIKKKHESTGQVSDLRRSGRPGKLNFRDESYIFREIRKNPTLSYKNLAVDFNAKFSNVKVSKAKIRRLLIKKGLESHTTVRKPLLTVKDRIKTSSSQRMAKCFNRIRPELNKFRKESLLVLELRVAILNIEKHNILNFWNFFFLFKYAHLNL